MRTPCGRCSATPPMPGTSPPAATRARRSRASTRRSSRRPCSTACRPMRGERARTLNPGRPSQRYLLRVSPAASAARARMQGTAGGRELDPRYYCASRRPTPAPATSPSSTPTAIEASSSSSSPTSSPTPPIRNEILRRLAGIAAPTPAETTEQRAALEERLRRARDLYEIGDLHPPRVHRPTRRHQHRAGHARATEPIPDLDQAQQVLEDFTIFWRARPTPTPSASSCTSSSTRVWLDEQPHRRRTDQSPHSCPSSSPPQKPPQRRVCKERERRDSNPRPPT